MNVYYVMRIVLIFLAISFNQMLFSQNQSSFEMTMIGSDYLLNEPFDIHYGPDDYLWITEKKGVVVRVNTINGFRDDLIELSDLSSSGGQDGLLGMAFHNEFKKGKPYVYISYTHDVLSQKKQKIVRYTYSVNQDDGLLSSPLVIFDNLPSSNDHQSGRLVFGPDNKLYHTIGDLGVKDCDSNLAQSLPTQQQVDHGDWSNYPGKVLRLNLDGSIPEDNPIIDGVRSHVYTYGHRNPQGLVFGSNGVLYSSEHGPSSDDELNIINAGKNYGWPYVAGVKDNLMYDSDGCHSNETSFTEANYQDPLLSIYLPNSDEAKATNCNNPWMCRPNIAPSSINIYESDMMPEWKNSLLITSLKKGRVYKVKLDSDGTGIVGEIEEYFYTTNRYRDIAIDPDGKSFYVITDETGKTADASGRNVMTTLKNPGSILKFTYKESMSTNQIDKSNFFRTWVEYNEYKLLIDIKKNNTNINAELINSIGKVVKIYSNLAFGINKIDIEGLTPGVYILCLKGENHFGQKRLILY
ncbi:PQQ-dependent sugar dehydrogenase [Wenyingzhuangia sp. IMCC45467]